MDEPINQNQSINRSKENKVTRQRQFAHQGVFKFEKQEKEMEEKRKERKKKSSFLLFFAVLGQKQC
jgi:hypothetical protein